MTSPYLTKLSTRSIRSLITLIGFSLSLFLVTGCKGTTNQGTTGSTSTQTTSQSPSSGSHTTATPIENGGIVASTENWELKGFALGNLAGNHHSTEGAMIMPDVHQLADGSFRMYYNQAAPLPLGNNILVASSPDGFSWTPLGIALRGATDDQDRMRIVGGASVLQLPDGRHRMFTRCSVWVNGGHPDYHIRSAISTDGLAFVDEGVVIDNNNWDPQSPWLTVGHGRFYQLDDGSYGAMVSVEATPNNPSDLALFLSADTENWIYSRTVYKGCHDPVVLHHNGQFEMVAMYLRDRVIRVASADGLQWPEEVTELTFEDALGLNGPAGATIDLDYKNIGDFGAASISGALILYSNFNQPSSIAYYSKP